MDFDRGCNPMTVNITENDSFGSVTRQYYYFEGAGITNSKTFSYQDPGIYQIVQVVGVDGIDDKTDTLFVEALAAIRPQVELQKCTNQQIFISSQDTYYDSIRVYFNATDSITLTFDQQSSIVFNSADTQVVGLKGFFNNADENCSFFFEQVVPASTLPAPTIQDAQIKETCKDFYSLYLELDEIDTLINYRINLIQGSSTQVFSGFIQAASIVLSGIPFSESDFCINIEAYDPCNDLSTFSDDFCDTPTELSLSPFQTLYSSYDPSGIYINLDEVNIGTFNIYRKLLGDEFEFRSSQAGSFTDPIGSNGRKYLYRIDYIDSCSQVLFTAETNPPFVDVELQGTNTYQVFFTPPTNSFIESPENEYQSGNDFSQSTGEINSSSFTIQLSAEDGSPRQFITATSSYTGGVILTSNARTVRHELVVYVPTAFTPNDDRLNDTLEIFGLPTESASIRIYNRWGQEVYTSNEPSPGWDGRINGSLAE
ncbi:MAG: gliding motility-associated C-terminal domain-containing protein, partial [Bacteroidota bacterium]